jgi:hypothetical protein
MRRIVLIASKRKHKATQRRSRPPATGALKSSADTMAITDETLRDAQFITAQMAEFKQDYSDWVTVRLPAKLECDPMGRVPQIDEAVTKQIEKMRAEQELPDGGFDTMIVSTVALFMLEGNRNVAMGGTMVAKYRVAAYLTEFVIRVGPMLPPRVLVLARRDVSLIIAAKAKEEKERAEWIVRSEAKAAVAYPRTLRPGTRYDETETQDTAKPEEDLLKPKPRRTPNPPTPTPEKRESRLRQMMLDGVISATEFRILMGVKPPEATGPMDAQEVEAIQRAGRLRVDTVTYSTTVPNYGVREPWLPDPPKPEPPKPVEPIKPGTRKFRVEE